jgi:hypothetical protein
LEKLECLEIILFNALAFFIRKSKIKATTAIIQTTRLLGKQGVKQDDFKALKFYQKACGLNVGSGCSNLGFMYEKGKGVKATTAIIQITRLLEKLDCFEIILFNAFAFFIRKSKITKRRVI